MSVRMDVFEFITTLVEALVWPLTVVLAIFAFRRPISTLLPFLQRLKYKDFVLEFNQKLDDVNAQVAAVTRDGAEIPVASELLELAQIHPRGAVIDSWLAVEAAIRQVATSRGIVADPLRRRSTFSVERELARSGVIEPSVVSILRELRSIRNEVAHRLDLPVTPEMARQYASAASRMVVALRDLSAASSTGG